MKGRENIRNRKYGHYVYTNNNFSFYLSDLRRFQ